MSATRNRLQVALQRFCRDVELAHLELTPKEWRALISILASFVARESARDLDREWRRAA